MNRIVQNMPDADYRAAEGVAQSALKKMGRSPAHFAHSLLHWEPPTPRMVLGKILHHCVLTPKVSPFWAVQPNGLDGRTKEGKEWKVSNHGKDIITSDEWVQVVGMKEAIECHPQAKKALEFGSAEVSVFADFTLGGTVQRKGRMDFVNDGDAIVDIKTVQDASPEAMARFSHTFGVYYQAAYYLDLWNDACESEDRKKHYFVVVAVEIEPPHPVAVYTIANSAIEKGRGEYISHLQKFMECRESGLWPGYSETVTELDLPGWVYRKDNPWATSV